MMPFFCIHISQGSVATCVGLEKAAAVTSAAVGGCREIIGWLPAVDVAVVIVDSAVI